MLFYILICISIAAVPVIMGLSIFFESRSRFPAKGPAACGSGMVGLLITLFSGGPVMISWSEHASDISKVVAQEHRIEVQRERIESLSQRLEQFDYPEKPRISLDADTPWASIVESLTDAENKLAEAKDERAIAIRSIEARKRGPMSGVVSFVGDYQR